MRVLMISKALVAGTSQRKLEELAKCPGVELTLITPPYWQSDDGSKQVLERLYTDGYRMIVTDMALNGNFHLHYYPKLSEIMREVRPEVIHIDEEPYNFATFQAMRLAQQHKAAALFFTWQNLYRRYPPPFRQIELYNYKHAAAALAGNREAADVLKQKGYAGPVHIIPQFGIDTDIYRRSQPRPVRAAHDPFTLGFIGRLKEEKGLTLMVEALTYLPEYCRVLFIGNGPMKSILEEQAARLGVAERVRGDLVVELPHVMDVVLDLARLAGRVRRRGPGGDRLAGGELHPEHGTELWMTDGTETGTSLLAELNPGKSSVSIPSQPRRHRQNTRAATWKKPATEPLAAAWRLRTSTPARATRAPTSTPIRIFVASPHGERCHRRRGLARLAGVGVGAHLEGRRLRLMDLDRNGHPLGAGARCEGHRHGCAGRRLGRLGGRGGRGRCSSGRGGRRRR